MENKEKVVVRPAHSMVRKLVDKTTINDFYMLLDERREIRWLKVKSMARNLEKKIHFESPIVINETTQGDRIIDGNHRLEALKMFLDKFPNAKVWINVAKYKSMNRDAERDKYTTWNKGTPESTMDHLKNYFKTIPYGEQMLRQLPVSLKNDKNLSIRVLVGAYINAKKQNRFEGGYAKDGEKTVEDFQKINTTDIKIMKAFISDMTSVFGEPNRKSKYWRTTPIPAFMRIWYDHQDMEYNKLQKAFKKIYKEWDYQWEENAKKGGVVSSVGFYRDLINTLKLKNKSYGFKSDLDIIGSRSQLTEACS